MRPDHLRIQEINIELWHPQMDDIIEDYYKNDKKTRTGMMPDIDINWQRLLDIERGGASLCVGALDEDMVDDQLVGFAIYFMATHHHHRTVMMATCDTLAVALRYRSQGIGRQLVLAAEPLLRDKGVKLVAHGHRVCYEREPIFPQLGFVLEELIYVKEL